MSTIPRDVDGSPVAVERRLLRLMWPFRLWILGGAALGSLAIGSSVGLMAVSAYLISQSALISNVAEVALAVTAVRVLAISRAAFRYLERYVSHRATLRILANLRAWFYEAIEPLAPARLERHRAGDLLTRIVRDVDTLEDFYVRVLLPPLVAVAVTAFASLAPGVLQPGPRCGAPGLPPAGWGGAAGGLALDHPRALTRGGRRTSTTRCGARRWHRRHGRSRGVRSGRQAARRSAGAGPVPGRGPGAYGAASRGGRRPGRPGSDAGGRGPPRGRHPTGHRRAARRRLPGAHPARGHRQLRSRAGPFAGTPAARLIPGCRQSALRPDRCRAGGARSSAPGATAGLPGHLHRGPAIPLWARRAVGLRRPGPGDTSRLEPGLGGSQRRGQVDHREPAAALPGVRRRSDPVGRDRPAGPCRGRCPGRHRPGVATGGPVRRDHP